MVDEQTAAIEHHRARATGRFLRGLLAGLLIALILALAIDNRRDVRVHWLIGDGDAPGAVVLLIAAIAGAVVGWLLTHRPHRHR
jgi:uncharacterized integral membrane protein